MKIVLLSAASSIHTIRWANGLAEAGHEVHVISQHQATDVFNSAVSVHLYPFRGILGYFSMVPAVRKLLRVLKPDIVNAHYASGYGTTARLVGYHPWLLSVWGSDVYDFPNKSLFHRWLVKKNLRSADKVASTSYCMADEARTLTPELKDIAITPFGVDLSSYVAMKPEPPVQKLKLTIGTVKTMKNTYGIDILIRAYALLVKKFHDQPQLHAPELELRLVGGGEQTEELKKLVDHLGVADSVVFVGQVVHEQVPQELKKLDVYVALSRSESFGVAIIEAGAAGRPVVVSRVGGLPEVTIEGKTGFIVPSESPQAAADVIERLVFDSELRHQMGVHAQQHVAESYSWDVCIKTMLSLYKNIIENYKK
ncbi:glycosyltransferase [Photobacterium sp. TLY01]|uniref:glycosyltransferase n=1 Tax=Photobacterium sp. TLY01 TaxID=2907534 RepID=UPI001F1F06B8|nr:glycosyltransferase [Photobacterium sp. TLY01]UIP27224.1 glycosyltransferase [Photobacterium sp. TLY01]